ncbi:MAG TPA: response regulator transcription factor [Patescibacteria group bacterium]|nr:response regulator transcription factor [Patescibacteria group bacterium]
MKKILVVDDDSAILEVVKLILEDNDYEVQTSANGDFLRSIEKNLPDLILLDVLLSGEDGRVIARKLKKNDKTSNIPIIMLSAHPNATTSVYEAGADDFVPKPFEIDTLLSVIARNLAV